MTGLGLALTEDQRAFGATVERYFAERYDAELGWREGASAQVWAALADLGVPAAGLPAMGGGPAEIAVAMIAAGRSLAVEPLLATAMLGAAVLRYASGPLADTLLSGVAEGTVQIATAYEEPGGRLDPAVVAATARAQGDDWRLDGVKIFALNAPRANHLLVTVSDPAGISLYAIARETPGVTLRSFRTQDGLDVADVVLDGVVVPESAKLGQPGRALDAQRLAAVGARDDRIGAPGCRQLFEDGRLDGMLARHEPRRADPDPRRPHGQRGRDVPPGRDAAGREHRDVAGDVDDLRDQGERADLPGMRPRVISLCHQEIDAAPQCRARMLRRADERDRPLA